MARAFWGYLGWTRLIRSPCDTPWEMLTLASDGWLRKEAAVRLLKALSLDAPSASGLGNWAASSVRAEACFAGVDFTTMRVTSKCFVSGFELASIRSTGELPAAAGAVAGATAVFEVSVEVFAAARSVAGIVTGAGIGVVAAAAGGDGGWGWLSAGDVPVVFGVLSLFQPTYPTVASARTAAAATRIFLLPREPPPFSWSRAANEGPSTTVAEPNVELLLSF